jgi:dTDP-4-dehydrorhamnose reductase
MKVYIAGCGGMLGRAVYGLFRWQGPIKATDINLTAPWIEYADVRDYREMFESVTSFIPDLIINLAALTDLEECEECPVNARRTNSIGAENLALIARICDASIVYISTAGVVSGVNEFHNDNDMDEVQRPLSVYGQTKYDGQIRTAFSTSRHFIFRPGWMMGGGPLLDKKFINKIYKQIRAGAKTIYAVDDKLGTPTYTKAFAAQMWKVIETGQYGSYNTVCHGSGSRYDVAVEFVKLLGVDVEVVKVDSSHFAKDYTAPRPRSEGLVNSRLQSRGLDIMPDWKDALAEYVEEFREDMKR